MNSKAGGLIVVCLLFLLGSFRFAQVVAPNPNEAWFADPARNLALHGHMGTTILEGRGTWLEGIDLHTYWIMPVFPLVQALFYKTFGFSLLHLRFVAILSGLGLLLAWYAIAKRVLLSPAAALAAAALLALETRMMQISANGRMDSLCAALGIGGIAAFLIYRRSRPRLAILLSHSAIALSGLTHPCGVIYALDLLILQYWFGCLRPLLLVPYAVFGAVFAMWIAQDPTSFLSQFQGNISGVAGEYSTKGRLAALSQPWLGLRAEFEKRYLQGSFGWAGATAMWTYLAALIWIAVRRPLHGNRRLRAVLALTLLHVAFFWIGEGLKLTQYSIHILPALTLIPVLAARDILGNSRLVLAAAFSLAVAFDAMAFRHNTGFRAGNDLQAPVVAILQQSLGRVISAPSEFAFDIGFDGQFREDYRLGHFTGRRPDVFVTNAWQRSWLDQAPTHSPAVASEILGRLKSQYTLVYSNRQYQVWRRRTD